MAHQIMESTKVTLDVRNTPPWERHPRIFNILASFVPGDVLSLTYDHDPRPLRYQLMIEFANQFEYSSVEKGPKEWYVTIKRI